MNKKVILFAILGVLLVGGIIAGLFFFLNRDKGGETPVETPPVVEQLPVETSPTVTEPEPKPEPEPVVIPSYLDSYHTYTELPGVTFRVPKAILEESVPIEEVTDNILNGKTVLYKTDNSFAIKKIGSFMMGVSYFEKEGVFDSMYVSSITTANKIQITEDMSFDFDDINFNSTTFDVSRGPGQKRSTILVKMVEPEYTNDVYDGYVTIVVNSQNKGYIMFVATTGSEYQKVDVQSMINGLALNGEDVFFTEPIPDTRPITINLNLAELLFVSGEVNLRNEETGVIITKEITSNGETIGCVVDAPPGIYKIIGNVSVKTSDTKKATVYDMNIILDNNVINIVDAEASLSIDLSRQYAKEEYISSLEPEGWMNFELYKLDSLTEGKVSIEFYEVGAEDEFMIIDLETMVKEKDSVLLKPGTYTVKTLVNDKEIDSRDVVIKDDTLTNATISLGATNSIFVETPERVTFITKK